MKIFLHLAIWAVLLIGWYGAGNLAYAEYSRSNICPKLLSIPACYVILALVLLATISQAGWLGDKHWLFFLATGVAASLALTGTIGQLSGGIECPKTSGGTPMCYLSLAMFGSLIVLQLIALRYAQ
jgi:hypothetical protein